MRVRHQDAKSGTYAGWVAVCCARVRRSSKAGSQAAFREYVKFSLFHRLGCLAAAVMLSPCMPLTLEIIPGRAI